MTPYTGNKGYRKPISFATFSSLKKTDALSSAVAWTFIATGQCPVWNWNSQTSLPDSKIMLHASTMSPNAAIGIAAARVVLSLLPTSFALATKEMKPITPTEKKILELIAEGFSTQDVAAALNMSKYTVLSHRRSLLGKFGVKNSVQMIKQAIENNEIEINYPIKNRT